MSKTERALEGTDVAPLDGDPALDETDARADADAAGGVETAAGDGSATADDRVADDSVAGDHGDGGSNGSVANGEGSDDGEAPPPDSTAEMMAQVDRALEHYAAVVEKYTTTEPMATVDGWPTGNGNGNGSGGRHGISTDRPAPPTAEDTGFFVIPETISPTAQLPVVRAGEAGEIDSGDEIDMVDTADTVDTVDEADGIDTADQVDEPLDAAHFRDIVVDRTGSDVDDDVLEELRRADVDGPTIELLPQDDTTSMQRRPRRSPEYDPAPMPIPAKPPRLLSRKPRVRKVTRVVRHVDPWSVFKIALVANLVLYVVLLTAGVLLWNVANATGTVDNVERFFESFGWTSFEFEGGQIYHSAWIAGLFGVIGLTGIAVLLATLFNLITDLVGGVRFTVLEEEVVERRTSPMRRFVIRRPEPEVPAVIQDSSGSMIRETVVDESGAIQRTVG